MELIHIVLMMVILGVILWAIETYIPITEPIKTIIHIVVVLFFCLWLLQVSGMGSLTVGHR